MTWSRASFVVLCPWVLWSCEADTVEPVVDASPAADAGATADVGSDTDAEPDGSTPVADVGPDDGGADAGRSRALLSLRLSPTAGAAGTIVVLEIGPGDPGALDEPVPERVSFAGVEVPLVSIGTGRYTAALPWLDLPSRLVGVRLIDATGAVATREAAFGYVDEDEAWSTDPLLQGLAPGELSRRTVERWATAIREQRTGLAALLAEPTIGATTAEALRRADAVLSIAVEGIEDLASLPTHEASEIARLTGAPPSLNDVERYLRLTDVIFASSGLAAGPTSPGDGVVTAGYRAIYTLDVVGALLLVLDAAAPLAALAAATNPFTLPAAALLTKLHTFAGVALDIARVLPTNIALDGTRARDGRTLPVLEELCRNMPSDVDGEAIFEAEASIASGLVSILTGTEGQIRSRLIQHLRRRLPTGVVAAVQLVLDYVVDEITRRMIDPAIQQALQSALGTSALTVWVRVSPAVDVGTLFDDLIGRLDLGRVRTVMVNLGGAIGAVPGLVFSSAGAVAAVAGDRVVGRNDGTTEVSLRLFFLGEAQYGPLTLPDTVGADFPRAPIRVESPCCVAGAERCSAGLSCVCDRTGVGESCTPCPGAAQCDPAGGCLAIAPDAGIVDSGMRTDAGPADTGSRDAAPRDAAPPDAAPLPDASFPDAMFADAAPQDASAPDASTLDATPGDAAAPDAGATSPTLAIQPSPAREAEPFQVTGSGFSGTGLARLEYSFDRVSWQVLTPDYTISSGTFVAGFCAGAPGWYRATDLSTLQRTPDVQLVVSPCGSATERCCTPAVECAAAFPTTCDGSAACVGGFCDGACADECSPGQTACANGSTMLTCGNHDADPCLELGGGATCGSGVCSGSACTAVEVCNGVDDDGNGVVDDPSTCWRTIYRFRNSPGARCLGVTTTAPPACSSYTLEREAFVVQVSPGVDTQAIRQCSFQTDHIVVPDGSADHLTLLGTGHDCSLVLGYVRIASAYADTPFAHQCPLRRFAYAPNGVATHIFSTGADNTTGFTCEPPHRGYVSSNFPCGGFVPALPGC